LASPIDKGFNRLAWLLPYSLAACAAAALGYGAYRLARRPGPLVAAGPRWHARSDLQDKLGGRAAQPGLNVLRLRFARRARKNVDAEATVES